MEGEYFVDKTIRIRNRRVLAVPRVAPRESGRHALAILGYHLPYLACRRHAKP